MKIDSDSISKASIKLIKTTVLWGNFINFLEDTDRILLISIFFSHEK